MEKRPGVVWYQIAMSCAPGWLTRVCRTIAIRSSRSEHHGAARRARSVGQALGWNSAGITMGASRRERLGVDQLGQRGRGAVD
jgi:hypothetical protein